MTSFQTENEPIQHQTLGSTTEDDLKSIDNESNESILKPYKDLETKYNSLVLELNQKNECYQKLFEDHEQLQIDYDILETHFEKLESDLIDETELNNSLQKEYEMELLNMEMVLTDSKKQYNELNDEYKTMEIRYNNVINKYNSFQYKDSNYLTWSSEQVFEWIINIKQHFRHKYSDILKKHIHQECIDGTCLEFINKTDLHRLGISGFKDKNYIYMSIQNLIQQTKRLRFYEYESKQRRKYKQIKIWRMEDILKWLIELNIPNKWYYNIINMIEINNITMEDIMALNSSKDVSESFDIENNIKLCNKIFDEIKKLKLKWERNNIELKEEYNDYGIPIDRTFIPTRKNKFKINLFSQGKLIILNEKVNKNMKIKEIKRMYKRQSGIMIKTKDIHLYCHLQMLPSNKTLREVNITNDKHLITVKFGVDGAKIRR